MTITANEIGLYIAALFLLFLTSGPVWVPMLARGLKDGFAGAWTLALMFDHVSKMFNSPVLCQRINHITGVVLICVGGLFS